MKILSLDYGEKRIGYAVGDTNLKIAFGREIIPNQSFEQVFAEIEKIVLVEKIELILVGLPKMLNGKATEQTSETLDFIQKLKANLKIEIQTMDERLTSAEATKTLRLQQIKAKDQKGKKDVIAAEIILQNYFDNKSKQSLLKVC